MVERAGDRVGRGWNFRSICIAAVWVLEPCGQSRGRFVCRNRLSCRGDSLTFWRQGLAREIARMTAFEIFAVAWIPIAVAIVIGFVFSLGWLEDRAERRRARHAAE